MKIFLTGATGYIGSAVLDAALRANHQITALVRTPQAADALASRGVTPVLGDLSSVKSYRAAADAQDAYIHTAADSSPKRQEIDRKAIETLIAAVMRLGLEHAGAERGLLILPHGDACRIEAEARSANEGVTVDLRQTTVGAGDRRVEFQYNARTT